MADLADLTGAEYAELLGPEWYEDDEPCHYCGGDGWGIVGLDWDSDDPINGPYNGDTETCPCCHGSGKEADATFW